MENIVKRGDPKMSVVLASNFTNDLAKSLSLTNEQINRAKSSALQLSSDPKTALCSAYSLVRFCFETARYNFTRDDCIYPVPFSNSKTGVKEVQAQIGYKGYRELAMRSGKYSKVDCTEVKECDTLASNEDTGEVEIKFNKDVLLRRKSKTIGYFAYAKGLDDKIIDSEFMTIDEVRLHSQRYSVAVKFKKSSPWDTDFDAMAKKTCLKKLCNRLSTTPDLALALKQDQLVFGRNQSEDKYLDNPQVNDEEASKTTVTNTIIDASEEEIVEPKEVKAKAVDKAKDDKQTKKEVQGSLDDEKGLEEFF